MFVPSIINDINTLCYPLKIRLLASFLQKVITEGMVPFIVLFLVLQRGEFWAGIIAFAILFLGVFFNALGGKNVCNKNITNTLILGELIQFFIILLMAFFIDHLLFIFLYLLKNIVFSYLVPFSEVFVFELTTKENRAILYQISGLVNALAVPLGAFLGGVLYGYGLDILLYTLSTISFSIFLLYLIGFSRLSYQQLLVGVGGQIKQTATPNHSQFSMILGDKLAIFLLLASLFIHSLFFSLNQFLPAYLSQVNNGVQLLSFSRTINGIVVLIAGLLLLGFIKKIANYIPILWTTFFYGILFILLFYVTENGKIFYLVSALSSVFYFISAIGIKTIYSNTIDGNYSGIYLSAFSLTGRFGNITASFILMVSGVLNYNASLVILAVLAILAVGCLGAAKTISSDH